MPITVLNGPTILAGESLSDALDCTAGDVVRLTMPADWTPANITFQFSSDGNFYNDLFDISGKEVMIPVVPGTGIALSAQNLYSIAFLKIRSGSRSHPVIQEAQRVFALAVKH